MFSKVIRLISVFLIILLFSSCEEENSLVLNPYNGIDYVNRSFKLNLSESSIIGTNTFNSGESELLYAGNVDENTNSQILLKVDKDLIINSEICENVDMNYPPNLNIFDIRLTLKTDVPLSYSGESLTNLDINQPTTFNNQNENSINEPINEFINAFVIPSNLMSGYSEHSDFNHNPNLNLSQTADFHPIGVQLFHQEFNDSFEYDWLSIKMLNYFLGADGCPDLLENGQGGCLSVVYDANNNPDPNQDNHLDNDGCVDLYEDGNGGCITDNIVYSSQNLDPNSNGVIDTDDCPNYFEDGSGGCLLVYDFNTNSDPNGNNGADGCEDQFEDGNDGCIPIVWSQSNNPNPNNDSEFNVCDISEDIFVIVNIMPNDENQFIEIFSTDNDYSYQYEPHVAISYDKLETINESINKIITQNNSIDFSDINLEGSTSYSVENSSSTINIVSFSNLDGYSLLENCNCPYLSQTECESQNCSDICTYTNVCNFNENYVLSELNSLIQISDAECSDANYSNEEDCLENGENWTLGSYKKELFNFDFVINETYDTQLQNDNIINDYIDFKFRDVVFVYNELDPSNDNFDINENPNGTEGNNMYDFDTSSIYEDFDDYGLEDLCEDQFEDGQGGCLCNYNLDPLTNKYVCDFNGTTIYNPLGDENNSHWEYNSGCSKTNYNTKDSCTGNGGVWTTDKGYACLQDGSCEWYFDYGYDHCPDVFETGDSANPCLCDFSDFLNNGCENINQTQENDLNGDNYNPDPYNDNWYDWGSDYCPDEKELGVLSSCENTIYNTRDSCEANNFKWKDCLNDCIVYSFNNLDPNNNNDLVGGLESGNDNCPDFYEDGNGNCCLQYDEVYNPDPNNDNYSSNPNTGTEGNSSYDLGEGTEDNLQYDEGEIFLDFGVDQLPDNYENYLNNYNDNWEDKGEDGCLDVYEDGNGGCTTMMLSPYDSASNNDPNLDNFHPINNSLGKQGNGLFEEGEGTENNGQYDIGEYYFDYGLDYYSSNESKWISIYNSEEDGFNIDGKEGNGQFDQGSDNNEFYYDIGLDRCPDLYENGSNSCQCDFIGWQCNNQNINQTDLNLDNYIIDPNSDNNIDYGENSVFDFYDTGLDGLFNENEPGYDEVNNPDPNNDDYDESNNPEGTENNGILNRVDETLSYFVIGNGEKHETFYDYGYDGTPSISEQCSNPEYSEYMNCNSPSFSENNSGLNYSGSIVEDVNIVNQSVNYIRDEVIPISDDENSPIFFDTPNTSDGDVSLWIHSIAEVCPGGRQEEGFCTISDIENCIDCMRGICNGFDADNPNDCDANLGSEGNWTYGTWTPNQAYNNPSSRYNVSVYAMSVKNLTAFEIHLFHDQLISQKEEIVAKQQDFYSYSTDEIKIIEDASIYTLDFDSYPNNLTLSYGHGMKNSLIFTDNDNNNFNNFLDSLTNSSQFTLFSDEYTRLVLYFDIDNPNHFVENSTKINVEYYNDDTDKYEIFSTSNLSIDNNTSSLSIPISNLLQNYIVDEITYSQENHPLVISATSKEFNFSRVAIDMDKTRIEVFYSK